MEVAAYVYTRYHGNRSKPTRKVENLGVWRWKNFKCETSTFRNFSHRIRSWLRMHMSSFLQFETCLTVLWKNDFLRQKPWLQSHYQCLKKSNSKVIETKSVLTFALKINDLLFLVNHFCLPKIPLQSNNKVILKMFHIFFPPFLFNLEIQKLHTGKWKFWRAHRLRTFSFTCNKRVRWLLPWEIKRRSSPLPTSGLS